MVNKDLLHTLIPAVRDAGAAIMAVRQAGVDVEEKSDASPVTQADRAAETVLLAALENLDPGALIVAEERAEAHGLPEEKAKRFWLVDPLDGTKEFIRGGEDFTVNVALIEEGSPVLGLVYAPATDRLYGGAVGEGAWIWDKGAGALPVRTRSQAMPPMVVASRSHRTPETERYLAQLPDAECVSVGSSLKFCLVATGEADIYPRLGPTMEWDTAAGDAVLRAAGGHVMNASGAVFGYNKPGFKNGFFVAWGDGHAVRPPVPDTVLI